MANRTRQKLIDVARQLFARKGIENTTMVDIANASEKGRRTIYTYFKSKRAIYDAVIEAESEQLIESMRDAFAIVEPPLDKLRRFIIIRFEILKNQGKSLNTHSDLLRSLFNRDHRRYEKVVQLAHEKERAMLKEILRQCMEVPGIDHRQLARFKVVMPLLQQGIDISFLRENYQDIGVDENSFPAIVADFVINAMRTPAHPDNNILNP